MLTSEQTMLRRWKDFEDLLNEENDGGKLGKGVQMRMK